MLRDFERILVVEDDAALCAAIARIVSGWGELKLSEAATAAEARAILAVPPPPDLVIIDVHLPDETAFGVLETARQLSPAPVVVAMSGKASPDEAFRLAQTEGSRSGAARLLHVTRQAVQQMVRSKEAPPPVDPEAKDTAGPLAASPPRRPVDRD